MTLTQSEQQLNVGDQAPGFTLNGTDGKEHTLDDYDGNAYLIVFMCNHCPFVKQKFATINGLAKRYKDAGLIVIGINANDTDAYPEDSYDEMQKLAHAEGFVFDYLYDPTQDVPKAYGAVCTPDPFLFDKDKRLAWQGRLDDGLQLDATPTTQDMADAIEAVLAGKPVEKGSLPSMGCNIKWKP